MIRIAVAFLIALTATEATASLCGPHDKLKAEIRQKFKETARLLLVQPNGAILEIFTADEGRTWTVLNVTPQGIACIMGAGTGFIPVKQKSGDPS